MLDRCEIRGYTSEAEVNVLDVVVLVEDAADALLLVEVELRVVVGLLDLDVPVADLALQLRCNIHTWVLM